MKKILFILMITIISSCSKDDDGGNCLVCDKGIEKEYGYAQDGSETLILTEYTWEETLSMFMSEGFCVGLVDAIVGGKFSKETLESYKVAFEEDCSVCSLNKKT